MSAKKAPASTALAKRVDERLEKLQAQVARLRTATRVQVLPAAPAPVALERTLAERTLTDVAQLGELGQHVLELTAEKEAILAEPVDKAKVKLLPNGAVYYPHIEYTRWFNRGFGRGAWQAIPVQKPNLAPVAKSTSKFLVTQVFVLFVQGKPIAQATAEGHYHENNAEQTHADVVEALNASALRRLAKRLGIGLELWDRAWGREFQAEFGVRVWVKDENRPQWRLKGDPPLKGETGVAGDEKPASGQAGRPAGDSEPRRGREPQTTDSRVITKGTKEKPGQVERLWAIAKTAGRTKDELKGYLRIKLGVESTGDILRRDYDQVIKDLQKPGPMLATVAPDAITMDDREPGQEG